MKRRRLILAWALLLLPGLLVAVQWARSYWRRDIFLWGSEQSDRREVCRLYSSSGRLVFLSHSYPVPEPDAEGHVPFVFHTGDRAATARPAEEVYTQMFQAGAPSFDVAGVMYARHVAPLSSGVHLWTATIVPWWTITLLALAPAASVAWRKARAARARRAGAEVRELSAVR